MSSPTVRTMALMKKAGYRIGVVERFIKAGRFGIRKDLFGFIDLIAVKAAQAGVVGVQTTSGSNFSAHVHKILDNQEIRSNAVAWLKAGNRIFLHGWRKAGPASQLVRRQISAFVDQYQRHDIHRFGPHQQIKVGVLLQSLE